MSLSPAQDAAMTAALVELQANYNAAWNVAGANPFGFDAGARASLDGAKAALWLLKNDLRDACRGYRWWPLDEPGAGVNEAGALGAWLQLAGSVRAATDGVKGYTSKWTALEFLKGVGGSVLEDVKTSLAVVAFVALAYLVFKVVR